MDKRKETRLTPKEFAILELLARNKGSVMSVAKIYEAVWKEVFINQTIPSWCILQK